MDWCSVVSFLPFFLFYYAAFGWYSLRLGNLASQDEQAVRVVRTASLFYLSTLRVSCYFFLKSILFERSKDVGVSFFNLILLRKMVYALTRIVFTPLSVLRNTSWWA